MTKPGQNLVPPQMLHRCANTAQEQDGIGFCPSTFQIFKRSKCFGLLSSLFLSKERENISFEKTTKKTHSVFSHQLYPVGPNTHKLQKRNPKRLKHYLFNKVSLAELLENSQTHVANAPSRALQGSIAIVSWGELWDGPVVVPAISTFFPVLQSESLTRWVRHIQTDSALFFLIVPQKLLQILHQVLTQTQESHRGCLLLFNKHNSIWQYYSSWGLVYVINNVEFIPKDNFKTQFNSSKLHFSQNRNFQRKYCWIDLFIIQEWKCFPDLACRNTFIFAPSLFHEKRHSMLSCHSDYVRI